MEFFAADTCFVKCWYVLIRVLWSVDTFWYVFCEAGSNYQIFCLWWIRNNTCGDSTISNRIEKGRVGVSPGLVWRKTRGGMIWFSVSEALLDDWAIGGSIDVFLTYGMVLVLWGFKDKIMLHCFREVNCQQFYSRNLM